MAYLARERIHLEVCPSSNVQTNIYDTYAHHPVDFLYRNHVSLGISTDTRTITNVTLSQEYERLAANFGWGSEEFLHCNLMAVESAFVTDEVKDGLRGRIRAGNSPQADV